MNLKRLISLGLSALTVSTALAACAPAKDRLDPAITVTSSAALGNAQWLDGRLETIPDDVVLGLGSNASYGIDMTDFENDGYIARYINGDVLLFGKTEMGLDRAVREYARAVDEGTTADLDTVYHEGVRIENMTIAGTDIAEFTVVYNYDTPAFMPGGIGKTQGNAQYGAIELTRLLAIATGVTLTSSPTEVDGPMIKIDYLPDDSYGENGFTYEVKDGNLYINGAKDGNGCANGVYHFLQEECGWEALMEGDSDLQDTDQLDVPEGASAQVDPAFDNYTLYRLYRYPFQNYRSGVSQGYAGIIGKAGHGMQNHDWSGHKPFHRQICHTDENNYQAVFGNILAYVDAHVEAGDVVGQSLTTIDISQADAFGYCKCVGCLAVYREENSSHAGSLVRFANRLSDEMDEYHPGLAYALFAYHGSNNPCKTKPRDSIYITFCTDGHCSNHPLRGGECVEESFDQMGWIEPEDGIINNDDYAEWIAGWGDLSDNIYVWYYILDDNLSQLNVFNHLADDMKFLYESNVKGLFLESENSGLGLGRANFRLVSTIMWDPEISAEDLDYEMDEILRLEYGDGYNLIRQFINLWDETQTNTGCWGCWHYVSIVNTETWDEAMYSERADKLYDLLEEAKRFCLSMDQEMRIERLQMDVLYRQCVSTYFKAYDNNDTETLDYLNTRYELFKEYAANNGYDIDAFIGMLGGGTFDLGNTLEEAAWVDWVGNREDLPAGDTPREAPKQYATAEG